MVLKVRPASAESPAREEGRTQRRIAQINQRGSRLARAARARALATEMQAGRAISRTAATRAAAGGAVRGASRLISPAGAMAAAVITIGLVAARVATGQSLETMGENLKYIAFGDAPAKARASETARGRLANNPLAQAMSADGRRSSLVSTYGQMFKVELAKEEGIDALMRDKRFQVDGKIDVAIQGVADAFMKAYRGGPGMLEVAKEIIKAFGRGMTKLSLFWMDAVRRVI